jgi:hypothetical protein
MIRVPKPVRLLGAVLCVAAVAHAQDTKKNPTSKIYVADTQGDALIDNGKEVNDLTKKTVYNAAGTVIETKSSSNASAVLSNGTGLYFDVNTRVEIREFQQDSFRPNRSDIDDEPSISTTHVIIDYGVVGVSTSKMVAGSRMVFETSLATASIRGRQSVIMAGENATIFSMIQGDATVQAGPMDTPHVIRAGQQILVRPSNKVGQPNVVLIQDIPPGADEESQIWLNERVLAADSARKLVYFEVQARKSPDSSIVLFDGSASADSNKEIVAVPVVPSSPPVGPVVSAANLSSP